MLFSICQIIMDFTNGASLIWSSNTFRATFKPFVWNFYCRSKNFFVTICYKVMY